MWIKNRRNPDSSRSQKWLKRNSLENPSCEEYVRNLCENMGFTLYDIKSFSFKHKALYITYGIDSYIISVSQDDMALTIMEQNTVGANKNKDRWHRMIDRIFYGDSCWYDCLMWIKKRR
jgi:hypothetical protein